MSQPLSWAWDLREELSRLRHNMNARLNVIFERIRANPQVKAQIPIDQIEEASINADDPVADLVPKAESAKEPSVGLATCTNTLPKPDDEVEVTEDPIVAPINKSELSSIVDNKPAIWYDDPYYPNAELNLTMKVQLAYLLLPCTTCIIVRATMIPLR